LVVVVQVVNGKLYQCRIEIPNDKVSATQQQLIRISEAGIKKAFRFERLFFKRMVDQR
jgi:hypothetical protein